MFGCNNYTITYVPVLLVKCKQNTKTNQPEAYTNGNKQALLRIVYKWILGI